MPSDGIVIQSSIAQSAQATRSQAKAQQKPRGESSVLRRLAERRDPQVEGLRTVDADDREEKEAASGGRDGVTGGSSQEQGSGEGAAAEEERQTAEATGLVVDKRA